MEDVSTKDKDVHYRVSTETLDKIELIRSKSKEGCSKSEAVRMAIDYYADDLLATDLYFHDIVLTPELEEAISILKKKLGIVSTGEVLRKCLHETAEMLLPAEKKIEKQEEKPTIVDRGIPTIDSSKITMLNSPRRFIGR